ncbi:hypothetical protein GCM10027053_44690 [Intrasporangium mesophilum]
MSCSHRRYIHRYAAALEHVRRRAGTWRRTWPADTGQISILILGLFALAAVLVLGTVDVTAAQLARMHLLDAADSMALDAADALDEPDAYAHGLPQKLTLTDTSVRAAAAAHLSQTPLPPGITGWSLVPPTGAADPATAVVTVEGTATLPMTGWILESLGGSVTITVTSRAKAPLL